MHMIMRTIGLATAAASIALAGAQSAAAKPDRAANELRQNLRAIVTQNETPPGQIARPDDPDMGDDNAAARAIFVVCVRPPVTPAAERSAICDGGPPITPQ